MKIALVAPLIESVPPKTYGGSERIVHYLAEALLEMGHDVTMFASGDSQTRARLVSVVAESLRLSKVPRDPVIFHMLQTMEVMRQADEFDIIHFHVDFFHYPQLRQHRYPHLTTLHGRLDSPDLGAMFEEFSEMPVVSISDSQRHPLPQANYVGTVYNGVPASTYTFREQPGEYLAFLGRLSPEKGPERAIEMAIRMEMPLKMAAKIDKVDIEFFDTKIKPWLDHPLIEYIGEVNEEQKNDFLGNAKALLFPIDWPEPFGLVMIESMACGTPVIAFERGSVPEVMKDGVSGYVVNTVDEGVEALEKLDQIDRGACRRYFEERFTSRRMAEGYMALYEREILGSTMARPVIEERSTFRPGPTRSTAGEIIRS